MNYYQFLLVFLCGLFFSLGAFYLLKSLLVQRKLNRFFFFSLLSFGGMIYSFSQFMLTFSLSPEIVLFFHRLKILSSGVAFLFWLFCIDDLFLKSRRIPKIYFAFLAFLSPFLFTDQFLALPVRHFQLDLWIFSISFHSATPSPFYTLYALVMIGFIITSALAFFFSALPLKTRIYAVALTIPIVVGAVNDFAVIQGIYRNIFLTEINILFFLSGLFVSFIAEEQRDSRHLARLNQHLEQEVAERTGELYRINEQLQERHSQLVKDLEMARRLQMSFIPKEHQLPRSPQIHVASRYYSVDHVGGDLYDVIEISPGVYGFLMADVSGHGVPAAMMTTMVKFFFNAHAKPGVSPGEICRQVNEDLLEYMGDMQHYVTAFFGILQLESGSFQYASAGHLPPILFRHRTGESEKIKAKGMFIGVFENSEYENLHATLEPGDRLLMFTDGIMESRNRNKQLYSYDLLSRFMQECGEISVHESLTRLMEALHAFREGIPVKDDQAILFLEYIPKQHQVEAESFSELS